jgi:hypothetical protein
MPPRAPTSTPVDHQAMPTDQIAGWHEVFSDNFSGRSLNRANWRLYQGWPGGDPAGWFEPRHVTVSNGMLVVSAYRDPKHGDRWATGGLSSSPARALVLGDEAHGKNTEVPRASTPSSPPGEGGGGPLAVRDAGGDRHEPSQARPLWAARGGALIIKWPEGAEQPCD